MAVASPPEVSFHTVPPPVQAYFYVQQRVGSGRAPALNCKAELNTGDANGAKASKSTSTGPSASQGTASSYVSKGPSPSNVSIGKETFKPNNAISPLAGSLCLWPKLCSKAPAAKAKDGKKRILIMMSNTGGGHKASADAIKAATEELYGTAYEVLVVDMWQQHTPAPFNDLPNSYSFMVKHSMIWRFAYNFTSPRLIHIPYLSTIYMFVSQHLNEAFRSYQPDLVVSVHPLMQHVPLRVLNNMIRAGDFKPINFATVVTDFTTCHNTWFHRGATRCFVPTEYCRNLAKKNGLTDPQLIMHGLPIRPAFSKRLPAKPSLRKKLGMDAKLPAVLLVGGGEGMGQLEETVKQLDSHLAGSCQVVVICGRNKPLLDKLSAWPVGPEHLTLLARGFVDNLHEWMSACDIIITKAGPGTIAEALIAGLPIILNGNIPCQEEGNIPYVVDNECGTFETNPKKIADIVTRWFEEPGREAITAMSKRSKALGRPEAVYEIARDLADLASHPDFQYGPAVSAPATSPARVAYAAA